MNAETLLAEQVYEIVEELRKADYHAVGTDFFESRFSRLANAGWVLGVEAFSQPVTHGSRGHLLRTPRNEWRTLAHFYNQQQLVAVWYYNNRAVFKREAVDLAKRRPVPAGHYTHFNKSVNQRWNTTK